MQMQTWREKHQPDITKAQIFDNIGSQNLASTTHEVVSEKDSAAVRSHGAGINTRTRGGTRCSCGSSVGHYSEEGKQEEKENNSILSHRCEC